ncbi:hypothetical protein WN943_009079 [Citrus x changshan-huyou]
MAISKALIASVLLSLLVFHLVEADEHTTVEVHARPGADYRRGQTCATGHVVPAAPVAIVFLQALQATLRSALATPI